MIALMQTTGILARAVAFVRSIFSRIFGMIRGLLGGGNAPTPPTPPTIPVEIVEESTALITPFRLAVVILISAIVIFAVIVAYQGHVEKETKKEAFAQGTFSHAECRGNDVKSAENEHKDESEGKE